MECGHALAFGVNFDGSGANFYFVRWNNDNRRWCHHGSGCGRSGQALTLIWNGEALSSPWARSQNGREGALRRPFGIAPAQLNSRTPQRSVPTKNRGAAILRMESRPTGNILTRRLTETPYKLNDGFQGPFIDLFLRFP